MAHAIKWSPTRPQPPQHSPLERYHTLLSPTPTFILYSQAVIMVNFVTVFSTLLLAASAVIATPVVPANSTLSASIGKRDNFGDGTFVIYFEPVLKLIICD